MYKNSGDFFQPENSVQYPVARFSLEMENVGHRTEASYYCKPFIRVFRPKLFGVEPNPGLKNCSSLFRVNHTKKL